MKMLMRHLAALRERGHWVLAVFRGPPGTPVLPPWARIHVDRELLLGPDESMRKCFDHGADVVMVGYFTQLVEFQSETECPGPVLYWDQGHEHVFGDPTASPEWDRVFHQAMHLPLPLLSVSSIVRDILAVHFDRVAPVVPNAIDAARFFPDPRRALPWLRSPSRPRKILLIGNPALPLKNFTTAFRVLRLVHAELGRRWIAAGGAEAAIQGQRLESISPTEYTSGVATTLEAALGPSGTEETLAEALERLGSRSDSISASPGIEVTWVCQIEPRLPADAVTFPLRLIVDPPQEEIPKIYRAGHDALLFCSVYEAWGMPALEGMASGVPVVSSKCHGVDMFAAHGYNAFLADPYDAPALARALVHVVTTPHVARTLSRRGRKVSLRFGWDKAMTALESALYQVQHYFGVTQSRLAPENEIRRECPSSEVLALAAEAVATVRSESESTRAGGVSAGMADAASIAPAAPSAPFASVTTSGAMSKARAASAILHATSSDAPLEAANVATRIARRATTSVEAVPILAAAHTTFAPPGRMGVSEAGPAQPSVPVGARSAEPVLLEETDVRYADYSDHHSHVAARPPTSSNGMHMVYGPQVTGGPAFMQGGFGFPGGSGTALSPGSFLGAAWSGPPPPAISLPRSRALPSWRRNLSAAASPSSNVVQPLLRQIVTPDAVAAAHDASQHIAAAASVEPLGTRHRPRTDLERARYEGAAAAAGNREDHTIDPRLESILNSAAAALRHASPGVRQRLRDAPLSTRPTLPPELFREPE